MKNNKIPILAIIVFLGTLGALGLISFFKKQAPLLLPAPSIPPTSFYSLSPQKGEFKTGQEFQVEVVLKTDQEINAADAVLNFDPQILETITIKPGKIFPLYPRAYIDPQKGKIEITGVKLKKDAQILSGPLTFATIVFKGKTSGQTQVNFVFSQGKTSGSTIVKAEGSQNILEAVYNGEYSIK